MEQGLNFSKAEHMWGSTFADIISIFVLCLMSAQNATNVIETTPLHPKILINIYININFSEIQADTVKKCKTFKKPFFQRQPLEIY